tara:strand:- start:922 stop:2433 length:1512 start_codon:yes stop_codon:yes gene_type:complete
MAISRMQEPQQIQRGLGSLDAPRQGYFLGKLVKKAVRGVKKIAKSPLGKAALIGGGLWGLNKFGLAGMGKGWFGKFGQSNLGGLLKKGATGAWNWSKANPWKAGALGLGAAAVAAPFLMGKEDEEEVDEESWTQVPSSIADIRNQARNYYTNPGASTLAFMPNKQFVDQNWYAADGGRAGLLNGGEAGQEQIEQMLMAEYVKYKNQGGTLSFEEFVQAVMQAQEQQPEGAGMEQPQEVAMAANGGRIGYAGGQLVRPSADGSRPGYAGPLDFFKNLKSGWDQIISGETAAQLGGDQERINEFLVKDMWGHEGADQETIEMIIDMNKKGIDIETISSLTGTDNKVVNDIISILNMKADGGRIGKLGGGLMSEDEDEYSYNPQAAMRMYKRPGKQEGGIMETEVAEEMIDMGGKEKDYRETGGFVDLGRKERADDVPARLSKNEFVFTADAVRAAGGGDIDRGSEVMQNMMDNLEAGGEISEESQGLEGAQAMYDQQQMLQSRIA